MSDQAAAPFGWERAALAAERVKERLKRSTAALDQAGVAYAVVGDNAVAEWVGRIDEDAVRNTRDVDILIRRSDLATANDFDLALRVITADLAAIESVDGVPPPLHHCIDHDRPEWLEWLLDQGADIERREQDYGATPLTTAVVMRQKRMIPILVGRGAKTEGALKRARNGLAGASSWEPSLL